MIPGGQELVEQVHGYGEHDGAVLLRGDDVEGVKVAQLHRRRTPAQHLRRVPQRPARLVLALRRDNLTTSAVKIKILCTKYFHCVCPPLPEPRAWPLPRRPWRAADSWAASRPSPRPSPPAHPRAPWPRPAWSAGRHVDIVRCPLVSAAGGDLHVGGDGLPVGQDAAQRLGAEHVPQRGGRQQPRALPVVVHVSHARGRVAHLDTGRLFAFKQATDTDSLCST